MKTGYLDTQMATKDIEEEEEEAEEEEVEEEAEEGAVVKKNHEKCRKTAERDDGGGKSRERPLSTFRCATRRQAFLYGRQRNEIIYGAWSGAVFIASFTELRPFLFFLLFFSQIFPISPNGVANL